MPTPDNCPRCRTPISVDSPQGFCPACLLRVALGDTPVPAGAVRVAAGAGAMDDREAAQVGPGTVEFREIGTADLTSAADTLAHGIRPADDTPENTPRPMPVGPAGSPLTLPHDGTWQAGEGTADDFGPSTADFRPAPAHTTHRGPPGYQVLGELGRGGMGAVYKARQLALDRVVALKVIQGIGLTDPRVLERFAAEARALGRLKHPNIVQVYDVGEDSGWPFYSLEYVPGGSLASRLRASGPLDPRVAADLIRALARAVGAAHTAGFLHRDIKPANVLLAEADEPKTGATGGGSAIIPKLTDFGLVKWLDESDGLTGTGSVMGTPSYMAPEQAAGRNREVGPRTDVYALGATLYETLTGEPPFWADTPVAIVASVVRDDPVRPVVKRPGLSAELEAICLKCLEKAPGSRYPSADALADDLGRWLRGESTLARPLGRVRRLWRRAKRQRVAAAAVCGALLAAGGAFAAAQYLGPEPEVVEVTPDPDAKLKEIQRELAAGKRVVLIGPTGLPRWHRWALAPATLGESQEVHDHTCGLQTMEWSLLELVQDPGSEHYRFTAEVRHDRGWNLDTMTTGVGLYFGYNHSADVRLEAHRLVWVALSEIREKPIKGLPNPLPHGLNLRHAVLNWGDKWHEPILQEAGEDGLLPFIPKQEHPRPWRTIVVTVTPSEVRVEMPQECPGRVVSKTWDKLQLSSGPPITPQSPLGICAASSLVSVRNVILEPLQP